MKTMKIEKCPSCQRQYVEPIELRIRGWNWSAAAYCDNCRPSYQRFLNNSDDDIASYRDIQEEIMQGWTNGEYPNSVSLHIATKPRKPIDSKPAGRD